MSTTTLADTIESMPLVDHHVHSVLREPLAESDFLDALTEAAGAFARETAFDSQLGFAVRRHCAPLLGLEPFASGEDYLAARTEIGFEEATRRFLRASGISTYLIDGGYLPETLLGEAELMQLADAVSHSIVRLESVAEAAMTGASSAVAFRERLSTSLDEHARTAIGYKTVAAYRCGLDLDPERPDEASVAAAAASWFDDVATGAPVRLVDPVLIRHLIWWALERKAVVQIHAGFGGPTLMLTTANPAHMQRFLAATQDTGGRIVFLHCYPYVREAGFMAHLYPHVYLDAGLTINYLGANAAVAVRETLELAPFNKVLFSSDAWGLPELVYLGARLWRDATLSVLQSYVDRDGWPVGEAARIAELVASRNAEELYSHQFAGD